MSGQARLLVVDDEPQIVRALRINLRVRQYDVTTAANGAQALAEAARHPPDVVILDLGLPDMDGTEVIRGLRGWTRVPIIVLSARHASDEKVEALDAGADDYVTKPFGMDELLARLRAAIRRATPADAADTVVKITRMPRHRVGAPVPKARWVIEAEAGAFERWGLRIGDVVELRSAEDGPDLPDGGGADGRGRERGDRPDGG